MDLGYTTSRVGSYWVHEGRVETGAPAQLKEETSGPPVETKLGLPNQPKKTSTTCHDIGANMMMMMIDDVEPIKMME